MSKPIKGVMPATPVTKNTEIEKESSNTNSFKPIKKTKPGTKVINTLDQSEAKIFRKPDEDELNYITEVIVEKLTEVFITRAEIKEVVEKTLQEMVANSTSVSKK